MSRERDAKGECLICGAPIEYLKEDILMECVICRKKEMSKTRCTNGHYICSDCHTSGMDSIVKSCLAESSRDPVHIIEKMMSMDFCHFHGPEHHVMVGAALLTAYKNAGGDIDLAKSLSEMYSRGKQVPGGACGFWGACGAGISAGSGTGLGTRCRGRRLAGVEGAVIGIGSSGSFHGVHGVFRFFHSGFYRVDGLAHGLFHVIYFYLVQHLVQLRGIKLVFPFPAGRTFGHDFPAFLR